MATPLLMTGALHNRLTNLLSHRPRQPDHSDASLARSHSRGNRRNGVERRHSKGKVSSSIPKIRTSLSGKC